MCADFLSMPQPCLRSSVLTKRYGWGFHSDGERRVALYAFELPEYQRFIRSGERPSTRRSATGPSAGARPGGGAC